MFEQNFFISWSPSPTVASVLKQDAWKNRGGHDKCTLRFFDDDPDNCWLGGLVIHSMPKKNDSGRVYDNNFKQHGDKRTRPLTEPFFATRASRAVLVEQEGRAATYHAQLCQYDSGAMP
jgi:hypothetical protein